MKRVVLILLLMIISGVLFGQYTNTVVVISRRGDITTKGEIVSSGTASMQGRRLDLGNGTKYSLYLQNPDSLESEITMSDGYVYNLVANIATINQQIVIEGGKIALSNEDVIMLKLQDTIICRIDGAYNQLLKSTGDIWLGVMKSCDIDVSAHIERATNEVNARLQKGEDFPQASMNVDQGMNRADNIVPVAYEYREQLFLITDGKRYYPTKKNFNKLFDDRKDDIKRYLKDYKIKLSKNKGVVALFDCLVESR